MQERHNSSALAMELHLSCTNPLIYASIKSVILGLEMHWCQLWAKPSSELVWYVTHIIQLFFNTSDFETRLSNHFCWFPGPWFKIKMLSEQYRKSHYGEKMVVRSSCLVRLGVCNQHQVSDMDWFQTRHETTFGWHHKGPVMSQWTNLIKWPIYPKHLIDINRHIVTCDKESMTPICRFIAHSSQVSIYDIKV